MEADDLGTYVVKFTGAGQGPKALVAEIVVGELGRALGIAIPELALVEVDPEIGRREPDEEVQELVTASAGLNLGIDFLPGAVGYDRSFAVPRAEAARVVWLDGFVANVDRSARNTNLLIWHRACGRSTTAPACASTTPGASRRRSPAGAYRWGDHVLAGRGDPRDGARRAERGWSPRSGWRRSWRTCPTPGCCRTRPGPTRRRRRMRRRRGAAYVRVPAGPAGRRGPVAAVTRRGHGVPVRRAAGRAADRPRRVRQHRRDHVLPAGGVPALRGDGRRRTPAGAGPRGGRRGRTDRGRRGRDRLRASRAAAPGRTTDWPPASGC